MTHLAIQGIIRLPTVAIVTITSPVVWGAIYLFRETHKDDVVLERHSSSEGTVFTGRTTVFGRQREYCWKFPHYVSADSLKEYTRMQWELRHPIAKHFVYPFYMGKLPRSTITKVIQDEKRSNL